MEVRTVWLLVRTKPRRERLAADALAGRGIAVYCPRILEPRLHPRAPLGPVPLFPSYVFVLCALHESFNALSFCPGVFGPVRFGGFLAGVEESDVRFLRERERGRGYVVPARREPRAGASVSVVAGPFKGMQGIVEEYHPAKERIRLLLRVASGRWVAQMSVAFVRVAGEEARIVA